MSIDLPLTVRIKTRRRDIDITAQIGDLRFRSQIPGGFASCELSLNRPLDLQPDEIELYASVCVYDGRHKGTIWEGRLEDPGRGAGDQGEVWTIAAVGPAAHASDRTFPIIYVDTSLDRWTRSQYSTKNAQTETSEIDEDTPCLQVRAEEGVTVTTSWDGDWIYRAIRYAGQKFGRIRCNHIEGGVSTAFQVGLYLRRGSTLDGFAELDDWNTSEGLLAATYGTTNWVDGCDNASLAAIRNTSTTTASGNIWAQFYTVIVRGALKNADGTDITSAYTVNNVDPAEVVADLLGRYLTRYDGANALIVTSGVNITQLAYPDGITAEQIFQDLSMYDPAFYWAAWETNPATGKHRFEYVAWPTTVRYEADVFDGFDSPGSASDLYNAVHVRWLDPARKVRNTHRTQTVQELTDAGLTREHYIDLADETGTAADATTIGDNFLAEHKYPPNAGTLKVARPIIDNTTGRMVMPWEILPGQLIRVRGVLPRVDSLNPTARDGVTVFKIVSVEYSAADTAATLELDSYSRTVAQALRHLKARRLKKR